MQRVEDSEDVDELTHAVQAAREEEERPSFISIRSHIAYPAPNAVDTAKSHGSALGEDEVRATKEVMGFDPDKRFWVDERVYEHMSLRERGTTAQREWQVQRMEPWREAFPEMAADWDLAWKGKLRDGWREALPTFAAGEEIATRSAGQKTMAAFAEFAPDDDRWRRRPGRVDQDRVRRRRRVLRRARRAQRAVRHPRARHGGDRQRRLRARRHRQAIRLDLPDVLRLHARQRQAVSTDGAARRVGVDARLRRPRRGRSHAPAGRALRLAARDPRAVGDPPRRRQRDGRRLEARARARGRPGGAAALAPEHSRRSTAARSRAPTGWSAAATYCGTRSRVWSPS